MLSPEHSPGGSETPRTEYKVSWGGIQEAERTEEKPMSSGDKENDPTAKKPIPQVGEGLEEREQGSP